MKANNREVPEAWVQREDIQTAFACLGDILLDENLEDRILWAQEIVSAVVGDNADSLIKGVTQFTSRELADSINAVANKRFPVEALDANAPLVWCQLLPDQVEQAITVKQLAAICATRLLPINDPYMIEHAVNPHSPITDLSKDFL